jgi:hypothetical protein
MNPLNYASLEASKRLAEAGIVLETEVAWFPMPNGWELLPPDVFKHTSCSVPAPSMAEVWRELPEWSYFTKYNGHYQAWSEWTTFVGHGNSYPVKENTNPTDALIDLLIWVRKEARDERSHNSAEQAD